MADHNRFLALRGEWSDMVDHYLASDDGQFALYTLPEEDEGILRRMLLEYADLISPNRDAVRTQFESFRKETFMECYECLLGRGLTREIAELKCIEIRNLARDVASKITVMFPTTPNRDLEDDIPLPPAVNQALDLALQSDFDPDKAIDVSDVEDPASRRTKRAPEEAIADLRAKARRSDDPPIEPHKTVPAGEVLKGIRAKGLQEIQRVYSQTHMEVISDSNPPQFHASVHPASPPPAPEPGVELGIESSIPPPPASDPPPEPEPLPTVPVADRVFSEEDRESFTGETTLSDDEYNGIVDAEIEGSGCFAPPSKPANQG
ncbi:MAG: hypothetical protein PHC70_00495 [Patescibacteria group bacterium]|nr:hypothetical protein [Patescibacteria group bacterium]